jgi:acyl dehydratase
MPADDAPGDGPADGSGGEAADDDPGEAAPPADDGRPARRVAGPADADRPVEGREHVLERTFTTEEVRAFGALSGDDQPIHTDPDAEGRLVVQGLLTATMATQVGGSLTVLAGEMDLRFRAPVYTGQRVRCAWTTGSVTEAADRWRLVADVDCTVDGETVLAGTVRGVVLKDDDGTGADTPAGGGG